jgi:hypothetical protein
LQIIEQINQAAPDPEDSPRPTVRREEKETGSMFPTRDERKQVEAEEIGPRKATIEPMGFHIS